MPELDDPGPRRRNKAEGDGEQSRDRRESVNGRFERAGGECQPAAARDHQPPEDARAIEREVFAHESPQLLRRHTRCAE